MSYAKVNLNDRIRVKLTAAGFEYWAAYHNANVLPRNRKETEVFAKRVDADGYTEFAIWAFMEVFGHVIGPCMPDYFDLNVLVQYEQVVIKSHGALNGQTGSYQAVELTTQP